VINVYKKIFVNAFIILSTFISIKITSETKQNYDGKPSYSALRSITDRVHWVTVLGKQDNSTYFSRSYKIKMSEFLALL